VTNSSDPANEPPARKIDLWSGGWALIASGLLCLGVIVWHVSLMIRSVTAPPTGDGKNIGTYSFDLSNFTLDPNLLSPGRKKDGIHSINDPETVPGEIVLHIPGSRGRGHLIVTGDRVIGVSIGGESRAYPLRIMNWHEIVNDTLGGVPIAVTYSALCDSVVVFDRRAGGETLEFGGSGLLYNSNLVMFDRREDKSQESLWSQLLGTAIAGRAATANSHLQILPCEVVGWGDWHKSHPETTMIKPDKMYLSIYKREPYSTYYASKHLKFKAAPLPPDPETHKDRLIIVGTGDRQIAFPFQEIAAKADGEGKWNHTIDGKEVQFTYRDKPPSVKVKPSSPEDQLEIIYTFRFAWYAMQKL